MAPRMNAAAKRADREARRNRFRPTGSEVRIIGVSIGWDIGTVLTPEMARVRAFLQEGDETDTSSPTQISEVYLEEIGCGETGGLAPGCRRLGRPDGLHAEHTALPVFLHVTDD